MTATYNSAWSMVEIENFEELNDNFAYEQDVVINKAIYDGTDVASELNEFGETFSSYSETVDPNYGFYQIYQDPNTGVIYIQNFLSNGKTISISGESLVGDEIIELTVASSSTESEGTIALDVGGQILEDSVSAPLVDYNEDYNQAQLQIDDPTLLALTVSVVGLDEASLTFTPTQLETGYSLSTSYDGDAVDVDVLEL